MSFQQRELQPDEAYVILLTELEQLEPSQQYCVVYPQNADINVKFVHIAFLPEGLCMGELCIGCMRFIILDGEYSVIIIYAEIRKLLNEPCWQLF